RVPRKQQDDPHVRAQPPLPPVLGREPEPLGAPAGFDRRAAPHRQARRRGRARRDQSQEQREIAMREKIKLESSAGTGHFYTTTKNKRTTPDKLEIKKYDPKARKHVIYKETKLK